VRDLNELQRLANEGHDESQFLLGYHFSRGAEKDIAMAKTWLERAAMANNPRAQYYLGELYAELGRGDPRGAYNHMAYWWSKSANHPYWETTEGLDGRAVSKRRLVWLHMNSGFEGVSPDEALRLLTELANKYSSPRSAIELGIIHAVGSFAPLSKRLGTAPIRQDKENGFRLIERGLKIIENGNNDIEYSLYNTISDVYLMRDGNAPRTPETLERGVYYKRKALERATGVNESAAEKIRNELSQLEQELASTGHISQPSTVPVSQPTAPPVNSELSEKFARFHAYFDSLAMEGKRDFITSLDKKLQANPNPDYKAFMLECVEKYRKANKAERENQAVSTAPSTDFDAPRPAMAPPMPIHAGRQEDTRAHYQEGDYDDTTYSGATGPPVHYPTDTYDSGYSSPGYESEHMYANDQDLGSYTDRIHAFGASGAMLFGALLYTLGGLALPAGLWVFVQHPRGILGYGLIAVLTLLPILPMVAIWMIYAASKSPRAPEKSLTSLTLFRITFFMHLALIMAAACLMALRFGGDGQAMFGLSIFDSALDLVLVLGVIVLLIVYVTFFYGSLFTMVKGIREGIFSNMFEPLPGVGAFSVVNYLVSIFVILCALGVILVGFVADMMPFEIPEIVDEIAYNWFGANSNTALAVMAFALILSRAGGLLCTNVVNQFAGGLGEEEEEE